MFNLPAKIIALSFFFLFVQSLSKAQSTDFNNYTPLKCEGLAPADFLKPSYLKYYKDVAEIKSNTPGSKKERKLQKEFAFITNYKIDEILMSGKVLYGNKVSDYINDIADKLLEHDPALKSKMRFYLLNVPYANALSTNNGIVFVTTGLIAQLENEAQLAFVLAHEISHFKLNHSFESYKNTKDIMKGKSYDDLGTDEKILKILKYSKNNESEADVEGLEMFTAAGYDQNESIKMMDILLYSYLPFDELPFPKNYFDDSFYKIPDAYLLDSAVEISAQEDEDDEEATHPNVEYRKSKLEEYIKANSKGELYLFGKDDFLEVLKLCRYEMGYLMVVKGSYIKAFYHAYLLEQVYGESVYTKELMVAAMYGINKYKLYSEDNDEDEDDSKTNNDYEGQISIVASLFNSLKSDEFNVLAARTIYSIGEKYRTRYINNVKNDVFIDLLYGHSFLKGTFNREKDNLVTDETIADTVSDKDSTKKTFRESNSKVRKIKKKKKEQEVVTGSKYYRNAFIGNFSAGSFDLFIDSINQVVIEIKTREESLGLFELRKEPNRRYRQMLQDERKIQRRGGKQLGIDSLIVIAPSFSAYYYHSNGGDIKSNNLNDELKAIDITNSIAVNAKGQDLTLNMIDINGRNSMNSDKFNQYSLLSNWITEKYNHVDKNDLLFSQKYVDSLIVREGFKNVCFTGFTYEQTKHNMNVGAILICTVFVFPVAPFLIGYGVSSDKELDYYYIVYDLETGQQRMMIIDTIHRRPKPGVVNLQIAHAIFQTKSKSK